MINLSRLLKKEKTKNEGAGTLQASQAKCTRDLDIPSIGPDSFPDKPPVINGATPQFMKQWKLVPISIEGDSIKMAMANPCDLYIIELLERVYDKKVVPLKAAEEDILSAIYRWFEEDVGIEESTDEDEGGLDDSLWDDLEQLRDMASEAPVIRLVNRIISQALEVRASDIHFEPFRDSMKVRFRIDGVLHDMETIPKKQQPAVTSRLKLMAKMNIAEMRLPQDGRIKVKEGEREIDIRVSSLPTLFGESVVLRLLNRDEVKLDFDELGFPPRLQERFGALYTRPYGMILVTGPTGSGKTTTLYTVINEINSPDKKILTVEDPVEYQLEGINQIQVNPKIGLTFASALRTFLRQDPDVILVGEIRDAETAEIAIQSALTGHMVFSTLHTNDAASAITRLQEMGMESYLLSSSLLAVLAQRLVRKICPDCRKPYEVGPGLKAEIAQVMAIPEDRVPSTLFKGEGCPRCAGSGFVGRTGIYELLVVTPAITSLILKESDSGAIEEAAMAEGMKTLRQDGFEKVKAGVTTFEEVIRVTN